MAESMVNAPINLVYILGFGRSGSTLLDLLLGSLPTTHSTGEIWAFPKWVDDNKICSCGERVTDCIFWGPVIETICAQYAWSPASMHSDEEMQQTSRFRQVFSLKNKKFPITYPEQEIAQYAHVEHEFFSVLSEQAPQIHFFVDSSKHLERLVKLKESAYFNIKVIHLVRDGLALIEASRRAVNRPDADRTKSVNPVREILGWMVQAEMQLRYIKSAFPDDYITVNYQSLAEHPDNELSKICDFLGIPFVDTVLDLNSDMYLFRQQAHLIGGNRLKFADAATQISYNNSWRKNVSLIDRIVFSALGGRWMNTRLGI